MTKTLRSSSAGAITRIVLYNPSAGSSWRWRRRRNVLEALRALPGTMLVPTRKGGVAAQTRELLTAETKSVFACGGDGTVSDVASGLVGTDITLGIIPIGTTNTLASEFGIPAHPIRAMHALIASSTTRQLRTWTVGQHRLVLGVGVGWDAQLMWRTPTAIKRRLGYFAFTPIGFALAAVYKFPRIAVDGIGIEDEHISAVGTSVLVSNCKRWAGSRAVFPNSDPSRELLEVFVLERHSRMHLAAFWLHMMLPGGKPLTLSGVRTLQLRRLTLTSAVPGGVEAHVNGDPVACTPLVIEPSGTVCVLVPARRSDQVADSSTRTG
jgi:diacylglycerol kinase (ATP)